MEPLHEPPEQPYWQPSRRFFAAPKIDKHQKPWAAIIAITALVLVFGLIVGLLVHGVFASPSGSEGSRFAPAPARPAAAEGWQLWGNYGFTGEVSVVGIAGGYVAAVSGIDSTGPSQIGVIDLVSDFMVWGYSGKTGIQVAGESYNLLAAIDDRLFSIDITGRSIPSSLVIPATIDLVSANSFYVVAHDRQSDEMCVTATNLLVGPAWSCGWSAPFIALPQLDPNSVTGDTYIFGAGRWINTGAGVRNITDGQPASFGADAGRHGDTWIYYAGNDRVFKVVAGPDSTTWQPWDTASDKGVSPAVVATRALMYPQADAYFAIEDSGSPAVTAYDYESGKQLWQVPVSSTRNSTFQLLPTNQVIIVDGSTVSVYSPASGAKLRTWDTTGAAHFAGQANGKLYLTDDDSLIIIDPSNNYQSSTYKLPAGATHVYFTPNMVFSGRNGPITKNLVFTIGAGNWFWLLDQ